MRLNVDLFSLFVGVMYRQQAITAYLKLNYGEICVWNMFLGLTQFPTASLLSRIFQYANIPVQEVIICVVKNLSKISLHMQLHIHSPRAQANMQPHKK